MMPVLIGVTSSLSLGGSHGLSLGDPDDFHNEQLPSFIPPDIDEHGAFAGHFWSSLTP